MQGQPQLPPPGGLPANPRRPQRTSSLASTLDTWGLTGGLWFQGSSPSVRPNVGRRWLPLTRGRRVLDTNAVPAPSRHSGTFYGLFCWLRGTFQCGRTRGGHRSVSCGVLGGHARAVELDELGKPDLVLRGPGSPRPYGQAAPRIRKTGTVCGHRTSLLHTHTRDGSTDSGILAFGVRRVNVHAALPVSSCPGGPRGEPAREWLLVWGQWTRLMCGH